MSASILDRGGELGAGMAHSYLEIQHAISEVQVLGSHLTTVSTIITLFFATALTSFV